MADLEKQFDDAMPEVPDAVAAAVARLWESKFTNEQRAFRSLQFRHLIDACSSVYPQVEGSRLKDPVKDDNDRRRVRTALENFCRWNGASWYEGLCPDAGATGKRLHGAFLMREVLRTHFVPLDRLSLKDSTQRPTQDIDQLRYGPVEIVRLDKADFTKRVPLPALDRFGYRHEFPVERLDGFYWLIVPETEEAGPISRRNWWSVLDFTFDAIGQSPLYEPTYPRPIEEALFVLLSCLEPLVTEAPWEPFYIQWTYSTVDDPFATPQTGPNPASLSWQPVGDEEVEWEVPDKSQSFEVAVNRIEQELQRRWDQLEALTARIGTNRANFNPLTKHFYVKALMEHGIDQIISNVSCIDATLATGAKRATLLRRYENLVNDANAKQWLERGIRLRDKYLHSQGELNERIEWKDLLETRAAITKAVGSYLELAAGSQSTRRQLLQDLSAGNAPRQHR